MGSQRGRGGTGGHVFRLYILTCGRFICVNVGVLEHMNIFHECQFLSAAAIAPGTLWASRIAYNNA